MEPQQGKQELSHEPQTPRPSEEGESESGGAAPNTPLQIPASGHWICKAWTAFPGDKMLTTEGVVPECVVNSKVPFLLTGEDKLGPLDHEKKQSKPKRSCLRVPSTV